MKYNLPFLKNYTEDGIYRYFNTVRPSLIRVDVDEVTYNLHIALRYEIEKKLINSEIDVIEVPELWNDFMEKYIGIRQKMILKAYFRIFTGPEALLGIFLLRVWEI